MAVLGQSGLHEAAWADKIGGAAQQPHAVDEALLEWSLAAELGVTRTSAGPATLAITRMSERVSRLTPPAVLDAGKVVCFARITPGVRRTGATLHTRDGEALASVAGLVITQESSGSSYYLLYCDNQWRPLTDTWHESLGDAKEQAEFEYEGIGQRWQSLPTGA